MACLDRLRSESEARAKPGIVDADDSGRAGFEGVRRCGTVVNAFFKKLN